MANVGEDELSPEEPLMDVDSDFSPNLDFLHNGDPEGIQPDLPPLDSDFSDSDDGIQNAFQGDCIRTCLPLWKRVHWKKQRNKILYRRLKVRHQNKRLESRRRAITIRELRLRIKALEGDSGRYKPVSIFLFDVPKSQKVDIKRLGVKDFRNSSTMKTISMSSFTSYLVAKEMPTHTLKRFIRTYILSVPLRKWRIPMKRCKATVMMMMK
jgi:hypothetical protein